MELLFWNLGESPVRHLISSLGSFRIASTAYQILAHMSKSTFDHLQLVRTSNAHILHSSQDTEVPLRSLLKCPDVRHPRSLHTLLYITQLGETLLSDPEGNFKGNQLPGSSMSLSPLCTTQTNDLHVSKGTALHHSFP